MNKCLSKYCRGMVKNGKYCYKCKYKQLKKNNPILLIYRTLRGNAKRRGKEFTLTLEEFTQFCKDTDYINKKGIKGESAHIDRIDCNRGYSYDNIQVLTNIQNNRKKYIEDKISRYCASLFPIDISEFLPKVYADEEVPF